MAKIDAFHTNSLEYPPGHRSVFHDQSECSYGKDVLEEHRIDGEDDRPRCHECGKLD